MVNPQQIKALNDYIQSHGFVDSQKQPTEYMQENQLVYANQMPTPNDYKVMEGIVNQSLPMPTADDLRRYQMQVLSDPNPYKWSWRKDGEKPLSRQKNITAGKGITKGEPYREYEVELPEEFIEEAPVDYGLWAGHNNGPVVYPGDSGLINYAAPWIPWENAFNETFTPQ